MTSNKFSGILLATTWQVVQMILMLAFGISQGLSLSKLLVTWRQTLTAFVGPTAVALLSVNKTPCLQQVVKMVTSESGTSTSKKHCTNLTTEQKSKSNFSFKLTLFFCCRGVNALAFSPNNKMIASGGDDNIIIWQLN